MRSTTVWYEGYRETDNAPNYPSCLNRHNVDGSITCMQTPAYWGINATMAQIRKTMRILLSDAGYDLRLANQLGSLMLRQMSFDGWAITSAELDWLVKQINSLS